MPVPVKMRRRFLIETNEFIQLTLEDQAEAPAQKRVRHKSRITRPVEELRQPALFAQIRSTDSGRGQRLREGQMKPNGNVMFQRDAGRAFGIGMNVIAVTEVTRPFEKQVSAASVSATVRPQSSAFTISTGLDPPFAYRRHRELRTIAASGTLPPKSESL
jgi:hypothetical protein